MGSAPPIDIDAHALRPEERRTVGLCVTILGALAAGSFAGVGSSLYLVNHYPLVLLALAPLGRHQIMVAPIVDPLAFTAVVLGRRMASSLAAFYLGRALGPMGIPWVEQRAARFGRWIRWLERMFERASHVVVVAFPGGAVSALAGISGMRVLVFAPLAILGLLIRCAVFIGFAEWLREPIEWLLALIDAYWVPGTVVLVSGMLVYQVTRRRAPV